MVQTTRDMGEKAGLQDAEQSPGRQGCTLQKNLACQHGKLRNPHNFVASASSDDHDDQKLI